MKKQNRSRWRRLVFTALIMVLVLAFVSSISLAQEPPEENQACLVCHANPDISYVYTNGESGSGYVSGGRYHHSVHGMEGMTCGGCHPEHSEYPHPAVTAASARDYTLTMNATCLECHPDQEDRVKDSVHTQFLEEGDENAATCIDCHGAHYTASFKEDRAASAASCRKCHSTIYDEYAGSVHGESLISQNNPDVPTCVDCHGVHTIEDPRTAEFRINSPELCATCHADEDMMAEYDISTNVFDTYVADFHGTTVIFEKDDPNAATNKAVCYDCHGVHNIRRVDDDHSTIAKENLLATCQECHPDADTNFPDSWTSHYDPTLENEPLVYLVNMFYMIIIPAVLGFMGMFVVVDAGHRLLNRRKEVVFEDEEEGAA